MTWQSNGQDGSGFGIYAQRYAANGSTSGTEFRINTTTSFDQSRPSIAGLKDGGFIVTWQSNNQDGSGYGIYGQRYNADGTTRGTEFRANTTTFGNQIEPSVVALTNGGYVVTWTSSDGQDGSSAGVYGQRYDANGVAAGSEFRINTYTTSNQMYQSAIGLADGGFVVTWSSYGQDGDNGGIYGQSYTASGATSGLNSRSAPHHQTISPAPR